MFKNKKILLAIGGGIAVYRVAELARYLINSGAEVRCIMSRSACEFVTPLTFEALTGNPVHHHLFDLTHEREMGHIQLARWCNMAVIAPATANIIARLAHGIADDLLTTTMLVCEQPLLLAPSMNHSMWHAEATQQNINTLTSRGYHLAAPETGALACGELGQGRLATTENIVEQVQLLLHPKPLLGARWVINAGPTVESWDRVRTLSNRASGQLGALLANHAALLGADVTLIAGPGTPKTHHRVHRINIESAAEMLSSCLTHAAGSDCFVATAAISDYRFSNPSHGKIKRQQHASTITVTLQQNPDIVAHVAAMPERPTHVVAFAAEAEQHTRYAREKMVRKGVDAIVANDIGNMGSTSASGYWITDKLEIPLQTGSKSDVATQIIEHIMEI